MPQRGLPTGSPCQVQLAPALAILSYVVHGQEGLRADLSATPSVLPRLFLAAVLVQDNPKALYHASTLIGYLAFSGVGYFTAPTLGRGFALPIQLLDRCVLLLHSAPTSQVTVSLFSAGSPSLSRWHHSSWSLTTPMPRPSNPLSTLLSPHRACSVWHGTWPAPQGRVVCLWGRGKGVWLMAL